MAIPLIEQIGQAVLAVLEGITTDNGYQITFTDVLRPPRIGVESLQNMLAVLSQDVWEEDEPSGVMNGAQSVVRRRVPFALEVVLRPSDLDATPIDTLRNLVLSETEKALTVDRSLGGLGYLEMLPPGGFLADAEGAKFPIVVINFRVAYRHLHNDPYTAA